MRKNDKEHSVPLATEIISDMKKTLKATRTCLEFVREQADKSIQEIDDLLEEQK